jgi:hypothetical protein
VIAQAVQIYKRFIHTNYINIPYVIKKDLDDAFAPHVRNSPSISPSTPAKSLASSWSSYLSTKAPATTPLRPTSSAGSLVPTTVIAPKSETLSSSQGENLSPTSSTSIPQTILNKSSSDSGTDTPTEPKAIDKKIFDEAQEKILDLLRFDNFRRFETSLFFQKLVLELEQEFAAEANNNAKNKK